MAETNLKHVDTSTLIDELKSRDGIEHASLLEGMYSSVSINGPVEVLMFKTRTTDEPE